MGPAFAALRGGRGFRGGKIMSGETATERTLTKDLPGLPIEFRNLRIDETGFHRAATRSGRIAVCL